MTRKVSLIALFIIALLPIAALTGPIYQLDTGPNWVQVRGGDVPQWSAIPDGMSTPTRIDLLTYVENGERTTFFLIRQRCANGTNSAMTVVPGNALGYGITCEGGLAAFQLFPIILSKVSDFPQEVKTFCPKCKAGTP